jgi:4-amino-4-deoxy-L-arabinose transferase-like glycosyltransferase
MKLMLVLLLAFSLRLAFFDSSYFIWDESVYLLHGKLLAGQQVGYEETYLRPPLLPLMISPFAGMESKDYEIFSKLLIALLNSFIVFPAYFLGKTLHNRAGMLSAVLIAVIPVSIINSRMVLTDHLAALLALSAFVALFRAVKNDRRMLVYLAAFLLALSILMKFTSTVLIFGLAPLLFILASKKKFEDITDFFIIFLLTLTPYFLYCWIRFSDPFYTFMRAWHVVAESDPTSMQTILYTFNDSLGPVLMMCMIAGLLLFSYSCIKKAIEKKQAALSAAFLFLFFTVLVYYVQIVGRGTAKPPGIEWEIERFMLLLIPFMVSFAAYSLTLMQEAWKNKNILMKAVPYFILILGLVILSPNYQRTYTPAIELEDGLRNVTLNIASYIRNSEIKEIACIGNCPPVAYYSGKQVTVFYDKTLLMQSYPRYLLSFERITASPDLELNKEVCHQKRCAYLYKRIIKVNLNNP